MILMSCLMNLNSALTQQQQQHLPRNSSKAGKIPVPSLLPYRNGTGLPHLPPLASGTSSSNNNSSKIVIRATDMELCRTEYQQHYRTTIGSKPALDIEPTSLFLAAMVEDFLENGPHHTLYTNIARLCTCQEPKQNMDGELLQIIQDLMGESSEVERRLSHEVSKIVHNSSCFTGDNYDSEKCEPCRRRDVMKHLRLAGFNAAICNSKWERSGDFLAGDHEYMDVIEEEPNGKRERVIIELDFRSHFEIARPSNSYTTLFEVLPTLLVATLDKTLSLVDIITQAAKQSLKKTGLDLPPWRTPNYVKAKWLSNQNRIISITDTSYNLQPHCFKDLSSEIPHWPASKLAFRGGPDKDFLHHKGLAKKRREADQLTVLATEWQLPALNPQPIHDRPPRATTGLIAALMQSQ